MASVVEVRALEDFDTEDMVEALWQRGSLGLAANEFKRRTAEARKHWWERLRLSDRGWGVWGLSSRWLAVCPWNGDDAWVTIPFLYVGAGRQHFEISVGQGKWLVNIDVRWSWE